MVLGTAGHIDHGKTALVRALTGTDTDRLSEEKARGITIELGFAELAGAAGTHFGVVDVPGHEAFVRAMVAGATGMDIVLLVVAGDEGVMPQTREHVAIVELLGVPELVVAITKCDSVDAEWLQLVHADVEELLASTPYAGAPRIETSAVAETGLEALVDALDAAARKVRDGETTDLARLPLDRVFTIQGTGTVVTGTLWSGALSVGDRVRVLPEGLDARIRGLEVHGRTAERAVAGHRVAVALTGSGIDREALRRGSTLVADAGWPTTWMLTTRVRMLADTEWALEHNQRVHVHLGTTEVLARCALLEDRPLSAGDIGWVQLRLEAPTTARAGDRLVLRAYSPVTTIGGGEIAEPDPPKRNRLDAPTRERLTGVLGGEPPDRVRAVLALAGWRGVARGELPLRTGLAPAVVEEGLVALGRSAVLDAGDRVYGEEIVREAESAILEAVERGHAEDGLRPAVPLAAVRAVLPSWAAAVLGEAVVGRLTQEGRLEAADGGVRLPGFSPELRGDQAEASDALLSALTGPGLAAPLIDELPDALRSRPDLWSLVRRLEAMDAIRLVADGLYVGADELDRAAARVRRELAGRKNLGPADFREVLPVSRKHLIPLLNYLDGRGTTARHEGGRDVPAEG